jgi:TIR domain/Pentapeptide repeats (8 copies)
VTSSPSDSPPPLLIRPGSVKASNEDYDLCRDPPPTAGSDPYAHSSAMKAAKIDKMAVPEHFSALKQGVPAWNLWRENNPDILPDLSGAQLHRAHLASANLSHCRMAGILLQEAVLSGAHLEGADLREADFLRADLSDANLSGTNSASAVFFQANLRGAILDRSKLYGAELRAARLVDVSFSGADLTVADLRSSDLSGARFDGADLGGANLTSATVAGTDFAGAIVWQTIFGDMDLSTALGLDRVEHRGPSVIDVATLYASRQGVPNSFLRGAGVPEPMITLLASLTTPAIDFYSCFLSYSTADQDFANRLYSDLQARGVRCWFAPQDIRSGRKIHEQIDEAIRLADRVLVILSESSMKSEWVKTEIAKARQREARERRQVLFPVSLVPFDRIREWTAIETSTGRDSAREIREYFIPDFSNWKDADSYSRACSQLLKDLALSGALGTHLGGGRA